MTMQIIRDEPHYCAECDTKIIEGYDTFYCPTCKDGWTK